MPTRADIYLSAKSLPLMRIRLVQGLIRDRQRWLEQATTIKERAEHENRITLLCKQHDRYCQDFEAKHGFAYDSEQDYDVQCRRASRGVDGARETRAKVAALLGQ